MKISSSISIFASLLSLAAVATIQLKPFDEKTEVAAARKAIESRYSVLTEAIYNSDVEKADPIIHEYFTMLPMLDGEIDDDSTEDEGDYLSAIEEGQAILSIQKVNVPEGAKLERKITSFIAGRRLATAVYSETMKSEFEDTEGEYGAKGKMHKLETVSVFHDQWYKGISDDSEEIEWYLYDREATSILFKLDGKPFEPPMGDGQVSKFFK
ncbi:MAG: hypothetical protein KF836_04430 [Fimbriimonadaceae bacterium]|nr:hypothetical protein [Fimbriimonadaceae bacterium]